MTCLDIDLEELIDSTPKDDIKCESILMDCPNRAAWRAFYPLPCEHRTLRYCDAHRVALLRVGKVTWWCEKLDGRGYGRVRFEPL